MRDTKKDVLTLFARYQELCSDPGASLQLNSPGDKGTRYEMINAKVRFYAVGASDACQCLRLIMDGYYAGVKDTKELLPA